MKSKTMLVSVTTHLRQPHNSIVDYVRDHKIYGTAYY